MPRRHKNPSASMLMKQIGDRLRWAREEIEPNQVVVAKHLRVDPSTLNKWEKGTRLPDIFKMIMLADVLRISLDYLYRGRLGGVDRELALRLAAKHPELVLTAGSEPHTSLRPEASPARKRPKTPALAS